MLTTIICCGFSSNYVVKLEIIDRYLAFLLSQMVPSPKTYFQVITKRNLKMDILNSLGQNYNNTLHIKTCKLKLMQYSKGNL